MLGITAVTSLLTPLAVRFLGGRRADAHPEHWTETARRAFPVLMGYSLGLFGCLVVAVGLGLGLPDAGPFPRPLRAVLAIATVFGVHLALLRVAGADRRVFTGIVVDLVLRRSALVVFLGMAIFLPGTPTGLVLGLFGGGPLMVWLLIGGGLDLTRWLGLARPAPPELQAASDATVLIVPHNSVNAFAFHQREVVVFTGRALEHLTLDEQLHILAHEEGHLRESTFVKAKRLAGVPYLLLVALWHPIVVLSSLWTFFGLALLTAPPVLLLRRWSRSLETDADDHAADEGDPIGYARALESVYRGNVMPVVIGGSRTHPDLYDRMVRLGVEPAYGRPRAPVTRITSFFATVVPATALVIGGLAWTQAPLRPTTDQAAFWMGIGASPHNTFVQLGDQHRFAFETGLTFFDAAIETRPEQPQGWAGAAWCHAQLGHPLEAASKAERAARLLEHQPWDEWSRWMVDETRRSLDP